MQESRVAQTATDAFRLPAESDAASKRYARAHAQARVHSPMPTAIV